jgi:hypothetical protein
MPGRNLHPMRCGMMFRIGRMRSAHRKASADELLIGFLPILLKFCNVFLSPPSPRGAPILWLTVVQHPKGRNFLKLPGRVPARPWATGKKGGWQEKWKDSRIESLGGVSPPHPRRIVRSLSAKELEVGLWAHADYPAPIARQDRLQICSEELNWMEPINSKHKIDFLISAGASLFC